MGVQVTILEISAFYIFFQVGLIFELMLQDYNKKSMLCISGPYLVYSAHTGPITRKCVHVMTQSWNHHGVINLLGLLVISASDAMQDEVARHVELQGAIGLVDGVCVYTGPEANFWKKVMLYSISQEICTRFCCALLCCGYAIVHNEFTWSIYPYSSGLLCWHWGNR